MTEAMSLGIKVSFEEEEKTYLLNKEIFLVSRSGHATIHELFIHAPSTGYVRLIQESNLLTSHSAAQ